MLILLHYINRKKNIKTISVMMTREDLRHTTAAQIAYITRSRSIQVELGKVEGFRALWSALVNPNQPFKYKAASSMAAYTTSTNQLVPSSLRPRPHRDAFSCICKNFVSSRWIRHFGRVKPDLRVDKSKNDTLAFSCVQPIRIFCETMMSPHVSTLVRHCYVM